MWEDPTAALARHHRQEAARRRLRDSQREDLLAAARILIPDHGLAVSLGRIAVHAGLSRHAANALFNATSDLAVLLVQRAWSALIERTAPLPGGTAAEFVAGLIAAIREDAPAHRIHQSLACGIPFWQREVLAGADAALARALGEAWRSQHPGIDPRVAPDLGRRLLALARDVALAPSATDDRAEAALITAMIEHATAHQPAARPQATEQPAPQPATPSPPTLTVHLPDAAKLPAVRFADHAASPAARAVIPAVIAASLLAASPVTRAPTTPALNADHAPQRNGHDPPAQAA